MYRSQKNIDCHQIDYKALYEKEKRLRQQCEKRAQLAELKYRRLSQLATKRCSRCMQGRQARTKETEIASMKHFSNEIAHRIIASDTEEPIISGSRVQKLVQNFAIFGMPQSLLLECQYDTKLIQGELLYSFECPSIVQEHAAKLSFPSGVSPLYYSGAEAKQKALEVMGSSSSCSKTFIMSFENSLQQNSNDQPLPELRRMLNPDNRLYAICMAVTDFSLVPNWSPDLVQSDNAIPEDKQKQLASGKALSWEQTDASYYGEKDCFIATSPRVYCVLTYYPFFMFFQKMLKAIVNDVKMERLISHREAELSLAEIDSRFFMDKIKQSLRELNEQISRIDLTSQGQVCLKLNNSIQLPLCLKDSSLKNHQVHEWGLPIINLFNVDTFLEVFTLIMLQEKVVFVAQNSTLLTFCVHLFTQLVVRPFKYPYPSICLLPENQGFFQTICPFVYGSLGSKKSFQSRRLIQKYSNVYVFLQKQGIEIISSETKKHILKNRPKKLKDMLAPKFKSSGDKNRRSSLLTFTDNEFSFMADKHGICVDIISTVNSFLKDSVISLLPSQDQIDQLLSDLSSGLTLSEDLHQVAFQMIKKQCINKTKDEFFRALLSTQIVSTHLFQ